MLQTLTPDFQQHYAQHGFVALGQVIDPDTADNLAQRFFEFAANDPRRSPYGLLRHDVWRHIDAFAQLIHDGKLAHLAAQLLDTPEIILFQDHVICKPPHTPERIHWHQDFAYWPLDRPLGLTMWIALDDCTPQSGPLHYLPGSHTHGPFQPTDFVANSNQPEQPHLPFFDWTIQEHLAVPVPLTPGHALAHHPLVGHFSSPNTTAQPRTGYSLTWIAPETRWDPAHAPHPFNHELAPVAGQPVRGDLFPRFKFNSSIQKYE